MKAGIMKHVNILQGIGAAISDQEKRHDLDTIAAIDNLFIATVHGGFGSHTKLAN